MKMIRILMPILSLGILIVFFWLIDVGFIALMKGATLVSGFWELILFWITIGVIWNFFKHLGGIILGYISVPLRSYVLLTLTGGGVINGVYLIYRIWWADIDALGTIELIGLTVISVEIIVCFALAAIGINASFEANSPEGKLTSEMNKLDKEMNDIIASARNRNLNK